MFERDDVRLGYKLIDGSIVVGRKIVTLPLYLAAWLFRRDGWGGARNVGAAA